MLADFGVVNFWTYLLGATLIVLAPGPETMFVIKTSITSGISRGFAAIFSILLSDVILVLLAWCGLAAVINSTPALFNAIKYAGAAYLFYLGVQTIRTVFKPVVETSKEKNLQLMREGSSGAECWLRY
jgi:leucine efflux protein